MLGAYLQVSDSFGTVYGPLTGIIALLLWAQLTSVAIFLGVAFAAQLEARRAGTTQGAAPDPKPEPSLRQGLLPQRSPDHNSDSLGSAMGASDTPVGAEVPAQAMRRPCRRLPVGAKAPQQRQTEPRRRNQDSHCRGQRHRDDGTEKHVGDEEDDRAERDTE